MVKKPGGRQRPTRSDVDARLKAAFHAVAAKDAPEALLKTADALAGLKPGRRDVRN